MASFQSIMKKFLEYYEAQDEEVLIKEFMTLKSLSQKYKESNRYPADAGILPINKKKNRFKDILPFEYTRVELHPVEGVNGSDYINANYVMGADDEIGYIAAQGPLPNTVEDFWRMLWYHNIEVVVMACREVEMGKKKCERYWPTVHQSMEVGIIKITTISEENISNDFVIRDLTAECQGETQSIRQYHYNAWPDHGKPDSPDPILRMLEMITDYRKMKEVPIVIHCSAGCGRTGTLIGIDVAKTMLLAKNVSPDFSVYKIVEKMRQQRPAMVQAKEQYMFVYMAIAELARRSIGLNPTVPPKPPSKPTPAPTGKSYMNVDTNAPNARSRSPTPSSIHSSSPPAPLEPADSDKVKITYENIDNINQPPSQQQPHGKSDVPEVIESNEMAAVKVPPAVGKRPMAKQRSNPNSLAGPPVPPEKKLKEDENKQPSPKPRARRSRNENGGASNAVPVPTPAVTTRITPPPPVTNRPSVPSKPKSVPLVDSNGQKPLPRSKTPTELLAQRPLPSTPESPPNSALRNSVSPVHSPSHKVASKPTVPAPQNKPLPPKPPAPSMEDDAAYSLVDPSQFDIGPDIVVMHEPTVPGPSKDPNKSGGSIFDTFMDVLGEDLVNSIENRKSPTPPFSTSSSNPPPLPTSSPPKRPPSNMSSRPLPSIPPPGGSNQGEDQQDDVPPEIPQRTDASLELLNSTSSSMREPPPSAPTYDIPGAISSTIDDEGPNTLIPMVTTSDADYEQPAPLSVPVASVPVGSKSSSIPMSNKISPPPVSPASSSVAASIVTMNRGPSSSSSSSMGLKIGSFFKKSKKEPKKKAMVTEEQNANSGMSKSLTRSTELSKPKSSLMSSVRQENSIDDKYKFPGTMGFGVRLERPMGPRDEPPHWRTVTIPCAIKVT